MTPPVLPPPVFLGLPEKFSAWRPNQAEAIIAAVESKKRFYTHSAPTGFGKTPVYIGHALLADMRTAILTSTKGLQSQLNRDFASCGLVDIRGAANYACRAVMPGAVYEADAAILGGETCDRGPCHARRFCSLREEGCDYYDQVRLAKDARLVVTNPAYWVTQHRYGEGLSWPKKKIETLSGETREMGRGFDLLVIDEAHDIPDELAAILEIRVSERDVEELLGMHLIASDDLDDWREWGQEALRSAEANIDGVERALDQQPELYQLRRTLLKLKRLAPSLNALAEMEGAWILERHPHVVRFAPVWPAPYAESHLFLGIPKVVLVSATIKEKTMELLGVHPSEYEFQEHPSTFPPSRRPIVHVSSVRCQHNWSEVDQKTWVRRIDQIIDRRLDRKGIVHTVSYDRRDIVLTYSRHRAIMLFNDGTNTAKIVQRFRETPPPAILVSPSLTTGWDLPQEECEYAIIGKIPFPDTRSPIVRARTSEDDEYGPYVAMQTIVQAAGRGMRSADDQCEVFIVDDHWTWFYPKFKKFAPSWFIQAVRWSPTLPAPLPKLQTNSKEISND